MGLTQTEDDELKNLHYDERRLLAKALSLALEFMKEQVQATRITNMASKARLLNQKWSEPVAKTNTISNNATTATNNINETPLDNQGLRYSFRSNPLGGEAPTITYKDLTDDSKRVTIDGVALKYFNKMPNDRARIVIGNALADIKGFSILKDMPLSFYGEGMKKWNYTRYPIKCEDYIKRAIAAFYEFTPYNLTAEQKNGMNQNQGESLSSSYQ